MSQIGIGTKCGDLFVDAPYDEDHPDVWWLSCANGHRTFATSAMAASGNVVCAECKTDTAARTKHAQAAIEAQELCDAGHTYIDQMFDDSLILGTLQKKEAL
jgi:hypothetical protein